MYNPSCYPKKHNVCILNYALNERFIINVSHATYEFVSALQVLPNNFERYVLK